MHTHTPVAFSVAMRWRRILLLLTGLCLSLLLPACTGKKILEEQALIKDQALSVVSPPVQTLQIAKDLPPGKKFHVGIRVSEAFMNRAATELLEAEVVPSRFENPVELTVPPFGTRVVLRPGLTIQNPRLAFTGTCPECIRLTTHFVGHLALDLNVTAGASTANLFNGAAMSGDVTLKGRLIPLYTGGVPSLGLQLEPLVDQDLRIETSVPVPGLDSLLAAAVRAQIRTSMARPSLNTFRLLPIKVLSVPGSRLTVNEIAYTLLTQPEGELFIGLTLNLTTPPEIDIPARGRALRASDLAVVVGQNTLTDAMRVWMAEGLVPSRYSAAGQPDPNGPIIVELKRLELFEDRYEALVRMWHIGKPPFWREYKMTGVMGVRSEEVTIRNDHAEVIDKAGPNGLVDVALMVQKVSLNRALEGVGSRVPREVGFPFGSPAKLVASVGVQELQTDHQRMTVYGGVAFAPQPRR